MPDQPKPQTDQPQSQTGADQRQRELFRKIQQLTVRAMKDEAWRQALLTNPNPLIEEVVGIKIPPGVTIALHENTATTLHFILPPRQLPPLEVSDADIREAAQQIREAGQQLACCYSTDVAYSSWPTCNEQLGYC
jgi:hypothetical protein